MRTGNLYGSPYRRAERDTSPLMKRTTYPDYPDRCGWNAMLPRRQARQAAKGALQVKYAVVGDCFTGLAAARQLSELDPGAAGQAATPADRSRWRRWEKARQVATLASCRRLTLQAASMPARYRRT